MLLDTDDLENNRRNLASGQSSYVANPVVCMPMGSSLLFENLTPYHYPVYLTSSLVNTNPSFDYSQFVQLGQNLTNLTGSAINNTYSFIFTFQDSGIYVVGDSNNTEARQTIIAVMATSQKCPSGMSYDSKTSTNLLMVGITVDKNIVYSPDWPFFIGVLVAVLAIIILSVFTIGYVYRKSWKLKPYEHIQYQDQNYLAIKIEDPEDTENALISLNADA